MAVLPAAAGPRPAKSPRASRRRTGPAVSWVAVYNSFPMSTRFAGFLAAIGLAAFGAAFFSPALSGQTAADACAGARDLRLTNGNIVTMDAGGRTVREVTIQDGRFTAVGPRAGQRLSACTRTLNLNGRTVVPGIVDNHNHIVLLGIRPGHHTPLESATSIADV